MTNQLFNLDSSSKGFQRNAACRWRLRIMLMLFSGLCLARGLGDGIPSGALLADESARLYKQARVTPGARQIGLSCAFFANVPLFTMDSGINIADLSNDSKEFCASIYGLRRGDFKFMSAFDREMFFKLFNIPSKGVKIYYRDAKRGELLEDAGITVTRDLAGSLDQGRFVSLRVLGEFGGPHNVLLLAHRNGTYYYHDPRTGKVTSSPAAALASKILMVSKARSKTKKRYFSSYHVVALTAPDHVTPNFLELADLNREIEVELGDAQRRTISLALERSEASKGISSSFPDISFATAEEGDKSMIHKDLTTDQLNGVFNLSKLAIVSFKSGKRDVLPVWVLNGEPLVLIGYAERSGTELIFSDGKNRKVTQLAEALVNFKQSGRFFGYLRLVKD